MPSFTAQGLVEPLEYDFNPYVRTKGVIPEPTDTQIAEFLKAVKAIVADAAKDAPTISGDDPAALLQALDDLDPDKVVAVMARMCDAYSGLCGGKPTAKQIGELPMRVRQFFFNWLQTEVMSPEAGPGGGAVQVTTLKSKRAG